MDSDAVVDNLAYLSEYLDRYRERVSTLEQEVDAMRNNTTVKDELDVSNSRLHRLEAEKSALRQEVGILQDALKVKQETRDVKLEADSEGNLPSEPNTVLSDTHQMFEDERQRSEALQTKCAALEKQVKESAALGAKALREIVDGEKASQKMRLESVDLKKQIEELQRTCDELTAANETATTDSLADGKVMEILRGKYSNLKTENKALRTTSYGLELEIASLNEHLSELKTKYKKVKSEKEELQLVKTEKEELQQTCQELIELVESLQEEVKANADTAEMLAALRQTYTEMENERDELQERCVSLERLVIDLREKASPQVSVEQAKIPVAMEKYRKYMEALPSPHERPTIPELQPICNRDANIHSYLASDSSTQSFMNHVLYLPGRISALSNSHFLAFGPTGRYDPSSRTWSAGSDLRGLHGGTRELFIDQGKFVVYVGTYSCHDLRTLCPEGTIPPICISEQAIIDAAFGLPWPQGYVKIMKQRYPDGKIKVEATGLQRVGFNRQLYDSLRWRFPDRAREGKRKGEDESGRDDKGSKQRRTSWQVRVDVKESI